MSNYKNEQPSGTINGINKVFVTSEVASLIYSVSYDDNAPTSAYSYNSGTKELTLDFAPNSSINVKYFTGTGFLLSPTEKMLADKPLSGVIDGVNKTFTVTDPIKEVLYVSYDGSDTDNYSFTPGTNSITFSYAPTSTVGLIDYIGYASGSETTGDLSNNSSLNDIIDRIYIDKLHEKTTSDIVRVATAKKRINEELKSICSVGYVDSSGKMHKAPDDLPFLEKKLYFSDINSYTVSGDVSSSGTSITIGTNYLPTSGYVYINGDIVRYTNNTDGVLQGLTGLQNNIKDGDQLHPVYKLPSDYVKLIYVKGYNGTSEYLFGDQDERGILNDKGIYSILYNFYEEKFIMFNNTGALIGMNGRRIEVKYRSLPPTMDEVINCILPGDWGIKILAPLIASRLLIDSGERTEGILQEQEGLGQLNAFYTFYVNRVVNGRKKFKTSYRGF